MNILDSIFSDGSTLFVSNTTPKKGEKIEIKIRSLHQNNELQFYLRTKIDGAETVIPMKYSYTERGLDYFQCVITCYENWLHYSFYVIYQNKIYYYNQKGLFDFLPSEAYDFKILYNYDQPKWIKKSVFYQIFPDRFCNGNPNNDVQTNEYSFDGAKTIHRNWNDPVLDYKDAHCLDFYGGDLEGVEAKIPYLKQLGVTAIYLNPIFYAATTHHYDCLDYFQVDPHLGGDKALASLSKRLHEEGMKLILDVSINHTGTAHRWFNKDGAFFPMSEGAYHQKDAKERAYYFFDEQNHYKSWHDVSSLPTLNYTSKELRKKIYEDDDSLVQKWLKAPYSIDGWRFDVADVMARNKELQLHHEVWPAIRQSIKKVNSNAYILGEDWTDCTEFLMGNEWDSAMNYYALASPIRAFVGDGDVLLRRYFNKNLASADAVMTKNRILDYYARLPYVMVENQFNLLDSHDVPRLHNSKISYDNYKTAVMALFVAPGAPSIYYGDEASIEGRASNEGCRYPMPWDQDFESKEQYKLYQRLAHLKTTEMALIEGSFQLLTPHQDILLWLRFTKDEGILAVLSNNDEKRKITLPLYNYGFKEILSNRDLLETPFTYDIKDGNLTIEVNPHQSLLIKLN